MAEVKIRDLSEEYITKIDALAQASGMSREGWLRRLLIDATKQPVIRECYSIKFDNKDGRSGGVICRAPCSPSNLEYGITSVFYAEGEALSAVEQAELLIRRNAIGDEASATRLLKGFFDYVYEVPPEGNMNTMEEKLNRILHYDYQDIAKETRAKGGTDCGTHFQENRLFTNIAALQKYAEQLYPSGQVPDLSLVNTLKEKALLPSEEHFQELFKKPMLIQAARDEYIRGYLDRAVNFGWSNARQYLLWDMRSMQGYNEMAEQQKEAYADQAIGKLYALLDDTQRESNG